MDSPGLVRPDSAGCDVSSGLAETAVDLTGAVRTVLGATAMTIILVASNAAALSIPRFIMNPFLMSFIGYGGD